MLHLRGGRAAISKEVYPDLELFWDDVAAAYRSAIAHAGDGSGYRLLAEQIAVTRRIDAGLLMNPHFQQCVVR